jgi:hypothetical protein
MAHGMRTLCTIVGVALGATRTLNAQVVRGEVREATSRQPVVGAAVVVRDSTRATVGFARTDERGTFTLRIPDAGFSIHAMRVGFSPESVSTAGLVAMDTTNLLLELRAIVTTLTPVVIEAEKRGIREMRVMGLNLKALSTHIITPSEIEAASHGARTYLDAIRSALPAGVMVSERSACVVMNRGVKLNAQNSCALVFVDGIRLDDPMLATELVQPQWLDHAIFVRATDAGMRFGTNAAGGVLLLFTKFGGYALERH